jgi:DNA-binding NarL/FixJ family response regulator
VPSPALRAGLKAILSDDPQIELLDGNGEPTERAAEPASADVVILAEGPTGAGALGGQFSRVFAQSAVLLLRDEPADFRRLILPDRPWGILPLEASAEEIAAAVHALAAGLVVGAASLLSLDGETHAVQGPLTEREVQILGLLSRGLANKQIALELGISEHTVKFHVSSIYGKLNASNRTQAVREGLQNGWIVL